MSLASSKRLRKLRDAPTEDVVAGNSYEAKLRRQFENINPAPSWAAEARKRVRGEKRKRSSSAIGAPGAEGVGEGEEEAMDGAMDIVDLLTRTDGILKKERRGRGTALAKGVLAVERLRDANQSAKAEGDIRALEFHPSPRVPILMTASADRRVRLFNVSFDFPNLTHLFFRSILKRSCSSANVFILVIRLMGTQIHTFRPYTSPLSR